MFQLAWDEKGMVFDLARVPDDILKLIVHWRNKRVREEADKFKPLPR